MLMFTSSCRLSCAFNFRMTTPEEEENSKRQKSATKFHAFILCVFPGAGFYVDAITEKWKTNYCMYSYITSELVDLVKAKFSATGPMSIMGHSMGGHGALICALKNPTLYKVIPFPVCTRALLTRARFPPVHSLPFFP